MLPPQGKQFNLFLQRLLPVEGWAVQYAPDLLQGEFQFPVEQNLLQPLQIFFIIEPVARFTYACGFQQADLIVVVQRAHAHAADAGDLMHGHHVPHLLSV